MSDVWNGVCLATWSQRQTLRPKPSLDKVEEMQMYAGYDLMQVQWYDLGVPEIPLDVRYQNFCQRLKDKVSK